MHVGFPDPAKATGTEAEILAAFRQVRDALRAKMIPLLGRKPGPGNRWLLTFFPWGGSYWASRPEEPRHAIGPD